MSKQLKITLIKSLIGRKPNHRLCARGLGLRRINHTVLREDTPENRGMVNKIEYMLRVEEV